MFTAKTVGTRAKRTTLSPAEILLAAGLLAGGERPRAATTTVTSTTRGRARSGW